MPAATQQSAVGPSALSSSLTASPTHANSKKRSASEVVDDSARDVKKVKLEGDALSLSVNIKEKDKKKKKKKKKRRTSVVLEVSHVAPRERETSKPRSNGAAPPLSDTRKTPELENGHAKTEPGDNRILSSSNKGKGKAHSPSPAERVATPPAQPVQPVASGSRTSAEISDQTLEIAKLKAELAATVTFLGRHQTHFSQHQQALTCQICLDLMHKPYALAPCGHMTCYECLVRWFTSSHEDVPGHQEPENDGVEGILNGPMATQGAYIRRRKNCPVCRAVVTERPIEMWGIKGMVASLIKSGLSDFPNPPPQEDNGANYDPWKNVFRKPGAINAARHFGHMGFHGYFAPHVHPPPPAADEDRNQMGWYDAEDGGIYRCIDCYHEIVYGRCTHCARAYPGHEGHDEDDDDEDGSDFDEDQHLPGLQRFMDALVAGGHDGMDDGSGDDDMYPDDAVYDALRREDDDEESLDGIEFPPFYNLFEPQMGDTDEDDESDEQEHDMLWHINRNDRRRNERYRRRALAAALQVGEEDNDEEASDYEGSFIDDDVDIPAHHSNDAVDEDDEDGEEVEERVRRRRGPQWRRGAPAIVSDEDDNAVDEDEDEDEEVVERSHLPRRRRRALRMASDEDVHAVDEDDEEEEEEEEVEELSHPPRRRRRAPPIVSDEDEVEVVEDPCLLARRLARSSRVGTRRRGGPSRPIVLEDDEEEDDEALDFDHVEDGSDIDSGSGSPRVQYTFDCGDEDEEEGEFDGFD